ncbi:MAG: PD-(D/E)XK nuclease family protein [Acidobacteriaceae bacterium]|nr:PD-(D/E)XK nuclease family protein [Acidobacteriaceae bacterium]
MRLACGKLLSWLEKGAAIITPTPLLARIAGYQFSLEQLRQARESWERPVIQTIGAWLTARWQEARFSGSDVPILLSPSQEHLVWRQIIEENHPELFDIGATASLARRAASIVREWRVPMEGEEWGDHEDERQFQRWHAIFRRRCSEQGWMTRADVWIRLPEWLSHGHCSRERTLFTAFPAVSPAMKGLLAALDGSGVLMPIEAGQTVRANAQSFSDFDCEIDYAARRARRMFEQGESQSIAIFVPDLATHRRTVEYRFRQVFYPRASVSGSYETRREAFQVHSTPALSERPLIASALLLLRLVRQTLTIQDASLILRCPFVKGAEAEGSVRASAELKLCRRRRTEATFQDLRYVSADCPKLTAVWRRLERVLAKGGANRTFAEWASFFGDLLEAVGWPGETAELSLEEQQLLEAWDDNLSALASLELVSESISFEAALIQLRRGLAIEFGTPELAAPVQILDASAAPGLRFDATLTIGLSDQTWPPPNRLSPLIPIRLQRACGVPGSDLSTSQQQAEYATRALFESAPSVVATYSGQLSSLVKRFVDPQGVAPAVWQGKTPWQSFPRPHLEGLEDVQGPPFFSSEPAHGGTNVLKSQSLCAFRAFAEYRLHAISPEDPCFGLDPRERGGFLHKALQFVWREIGNSDRLAETSSDALAQIVEAGVNSAVSESSHDSFHQLISVAERERLKKLILEWLDVERGRNQPFAVEILEEEREFSIPGLRLALRVDRIDRLANGNVLLIDYKSSSMSRNRLACPNPAEPQLLIYAAAVGESVDGLLFAELRPGSTRPVGFTRERHFESKTVDVVRNWRRFLADNKNEVLRLSEDFIRGYAAVDPKSGACKYCQVSSICRVGEVHPQKGEAD